MYIDVTPGGPPLKFNINRNSGNASKWNIKMTKYACGSSSIAPSGCLQYYTAVAGSVSSFNYQGGSSTTNTQQIANLDYTVCIRPGDYYCSVNYGLDRSKGNYAFTMT